jgi:YscD/CdsD-like Bon-like domain 3/Inner membrane component of T3SS, cytoplasmic domain
MDITDIRDASFIRDASLPVTASHAVASQAVLEVVDGVHEGVSIPLDKSVYTIGSKPSVDIMLGDSGVAPEHGVVRLQGFSVLVEAAGGDIGLGKRHIPHGHGCRANLPVELKLGTAVLRIARPRTSGPWLDRQAVLRLAAVGGVGCLALIPILGFGTDVGVGQLSAAVVADPPAAPSPSGAVAPASVSHVASASAPRVVPAAIVDALTARMDDNGLKDLRAKVDGTRVIVFGTILPDQRGSWSEIQHWFDQTHGARYILASTVQTRSPTANPKFDLQAISFSDTPYVITADGQRRYPGAVLDQGWVIKEIRANRLTLTKDGKELALTF